MSSEQPAIIVNKEDYYQDTKCVSFSMLRDFEKCETLYREKHIDKLYTEPDHDYLTYGKLVDAFVTESPEYVKNNFVLVDKRVKPEDALKYENTIARLQEELVPINEKAAEGNKTAIKGKAKREADIADYQSRLTALKNMVGKEQVTKALWEEAEQTALAIKTHAYYSSMTFDQFTSQQIFTVKIGGIMRKGRLDHLKLCPQIEKLYKLFIAKQISYQEMGNKIAQFDPRELWAIITDIKTCYSIKEVEPFNEHWRGQLAYYQDLVSEFLLIPAANIKCQILAGDKVSNNFKLSELFSFPQDALDERKEVLNDLVVRWKKAVDTNTFISAKVKKGFEQECYTCQECRQAPFSKVPGQAVMVAKARFSGGGGEREQVIASNKKIDPHYIDPLLA